ncbi:amino acid deaminase [Gilvimarinus xylanilyticus]|uniref:Amino acid deaminase n=1 Tax=Gilvimarinus xylanilyticus TaxID=2944139 RepID=A0A9X2I660_9GAMM|nr:amino acid deaminase [Gilvimarinus xylanilyticus]MCP8901025.1 amino acid deaminase [Gilvimarinus xylanilyticus]
MPSLLSENISLPAAVVYRSRLANNLHWMQSYADSQRVKLAPHGKTTMTPRFFQLQREAGAWGITLASAPQAIAAAQAGIDRILMANQLVGKANMQLVAELMETTGVEFFCLVDSPDNARQLGDYFHQRGLVLNLLIEMGVPGGRCGCRSEDEARQLAQSIQPHPGLNLRGIETYEGVIGGPDACDKIRTHLEWVRDITLGFQQQGLFAHPQAILTGAGSAWYDLVAEVFGDTPADRIIPVIRPGCYLIHDKGIYMQAQQQVRERLGDNCNVAGDLQSALEVWAYVQSLPEPGLAILTLGKRDCAFDAGLPQPSLHYRPGTEVPVAPPEDWEVFHIMDQHSAMRVSPSADIKVGDMIALSTSHPCLTFDKWRQLHIIDDNYTLVEQVNTCF